MNEAEHPDGDNGLLGLGDDEALRGSLRAPEEYLLDVSRTRCFVGETVLNIP